MKALLYSLCLLGVLVSAVRAEEERREDTATYRITEPDQPTAGPAAVAATIPLAVPTATTVPAALAELRARHQAALASLEQALASVRDHAECESLERQAATLKTTQQKEELEWLRADALSRGDAAYAARLDEALRDLEPKAPPVATTFVPRDPATGQALDGSAEGGAK